MLKNTSCKSGNSPQFLQLDLDNNCWDWLDWCGHPIWYQGVLRRGPESHFAFFFGGVTGSLPFSTFNRPLRHSLWLLPPHIFEETKFCAPQTKLVIISVLVEFNRADCDKDCNPYDGVNYIIFGNGNGITATSCGSSWASWRYWIGPRNGNRWIWYIYMAVSHSNPQQKPEIVTRMVETWWNLKPWNQIWSQVSDRFSELRGV